MMNIENYITKVEDVMKDELLMNAYRQIINENILEKAKNKNIITIGTKFEDDNFEKIVGYSIAFFVNGKIYSIDTCNNELSYNIVKDTIFYNGMEHAKKSYMSKNKELFCQLLEKDIKEDKYLNY